MDQVEQKFLATQINQPLIWLWYIDDIFFIWTHGEKEQEKFMSSFNSFTPNIKFTYESSQKDISFLDFNRHKSNMKIWFQKRGYPANIIENEMKKVKFPSCNKIQRKNSKGIAFVVTYHPLLKQLEGILCRNKYLLNMNAEVKQAFTPVPMVFYRSSRKLSSYLVRAKLYL